MIRFRSETENLTCLSGQICVYIYIWHTIDWISFRPLNPSLEYLVHLFKLSFHDESHGGIDPYPSHLSQGANLGSQNSLAGPTNFRASGVSFDNNVE